MASGRPSSELRNRSEPISELAETIIIPENDEMDIENSTAQSTIDENCLEMDEFYEVSDLCCITAGPSLENKVIDKNSTPPVISCQPTKSHSSKPQNHAKTNAPSTIEKWKEELIKQSLKERRELHCIRMAQAEAELRNIDVLYRLAEKQLQNAEQQQENAEKQHLNAEEEHKVRLAILKAELKVALTNAGS